MNIRTLAILFAVGGSCFIGAAAHADIPAGYTGTPYLGTPKVIPGKVNLVDVDLGGEGIAYHADHRRSNSAGYEPISGNDYRPGDKDLPNICKTNVNPPPDTFVDGSPYPPPPDKSWYYIGYAHAVDWVKITVDVKQAGTYNVSSNWASEGATWGLSIWFNDGKSPPDPLRPKDGVNKSGIIEMPGTSDYHKWKAYPNFAKVTLSAGVQVMTFHLERHDHLQYGFLQFDLEGAAPTGAAGTGGGAAGTGGGMAGTSGIVTGAAGTGSTTGAAGTGGVVTGAAGDVGATGAAGTAPTTGAAGTGGSTTGAAGTPGAAGRPGSAGTSGVTPGGDGGGCACSIGARTEARTASALLFVLLGAALARRRRR